MENLMSFLSKSYAETKKNLQQIAFVRLLYGRMKRCIVSSEDITELSRLIEQNQIVVLKPFSQMKENEMASMVIHGVVKKYLNGYQTVALSKSRSKQLAIPTSTVLLRYPLALLAIPSAHDDYLKVVGAKTRNTIRKAEKQGYEFREFEWNRHLEEIFDINTSKRIRSGGIMHGWYTEPVKPRNYGKEDKHFLKYYGVFKENRLWAYCHWVLCGDFAFLKHFLGHADHLNNGIMNFLMSCSVKNFIGHSHIRWLSYGMLPAGVSGGTIAFRKSVGFEGYATFLDLENNEALLKYSKHVRARGLISV